MLSNKGSRQRTHGVASICLCTVGELVQRLDALRTNANVTCGQIVNELPGSQIRRFNSLDTAMRVLCALLERRPTLARSKKSDAGLDVIDVALDILWKMVLVAGSGSMARSAVLEVVKLGMQHLLGLVSGGAELEPALVPGEPDVVFQDAGRLYPVFDLVDSLRVSLEHLDNILGRPVL